MIKVLVCDGDGTLGLPNPSRDIRNLLAALETSGIQLAVATNNQRRLIERNFQRAGLASPSIIVTRQDIGQPKPSPEFLRRIARLCKVNLHEMVYIGDDDKTDIFCAINAGVLPLAAKYSKSPTTIEYGLPVNHPKVLQDYLVVYGKQEDPYFGWDYNNRCADTGKPIDVRALFGEHKQLGITGKLKSLLKDDEDVPVNQHGTMFSAVLFHYFINQCYQSGLMAAVDMVTVYPGHLPGNPNPVLQAFSRILALNFRKYTPDLLVRHAAALPAHFQAVRQIYDQFRTINVNPSHPKAVENSSIMVIDDFTTSGNGFETARRMLLAAGASHVICVAMAKYRNEYTETQIAKKWDPYIPCTLAIDDIRTTRAEGTINDKADKFFENTVMPTYFKRQ